MKSTSVSNKKFRRKNQHTYFLKKEKGLKLNLKNLFVIIKLIYITIIIANNSN